MAGGEGTKKKDKDPFSWDESVQDYNLPILKEQMNVVIMNYFVTEVCKQHKNRQRQSFVGGGVCTHCSLSLPLPLPLFLSFFFILV